MTTTDEALSTLLSDSSLSWEEEKERLSQVVGDLQEGDASAPSYGNDACVSGFDSYHDWGRRWGNYCFYIDAGHLEPCLPETTSARDHVALLDGPHEEGEQHADRR